VVCNGRISGCTSAPVKELVRAREAEVGDVMR
jgi:hypothetical protein